MADHVWWECKRCGKALIVGEEESVSLIKYDEEAQKEFSSEGIE
jgi:hypothetical protein